MEAEASARRALKLLGTTDLAHDRVNALLALADALEARGMSEEAAAARDDAISVLRAKANPAAVDRLARWAGIAPKHGGRGAPRGSLRHALDK